MSCKPQQESLLCLDCLLWSHCEFLTSDHKIFMSLRLNHKHAHTRFDEMSPNFSWQHLPARPPAGPPTVIQLKRPAGLVTAGLV